MTRIDLEVVGAGYRVWHSHRVLVQHSRDPEPEACRALLALGVTGAAETYKLGGARARMRFDIEAMAASESGNEAQHAKR